MTEMSADIYRVINSIFYNKVFWSWDRMKIWRNFVSRLWIKSPTVPNDKNKLYLLQFNGL